MSGPDAAWSDADRTRLIAEIRAWLWLFMGSGVPGPGERRGVLAGLLALPEAELRRLCALHFLLSPAVAALLDEAPAALRGGARGTTRGAEGRAGLPGRPDWAATARRRAMAGGDSTLYVYSTPRRDLAYEVRLAATLRAIAAAAGVALAGRPPTTAAPAEGQDAAALWPVTCARRGTAARRLLAHPRLAGLPEAPEPGEPADRRAPPRWWPHVEAASLLHHRLLVEADPRALLDAVGDRVLEPANDDVLFEVWATLATLAALADLGWAQHTLHLLAPGRGGPLATYATAAGAGEATRITLYAQHTPPAWRRASRYATIFRRYGLSGGVRRPDLILEVQGGTPRWLLVEVKRTADPAYIAESIYKVLGYLADFAPLLEHAPEPHAILLVWRPGGAASAATPVQGPLVVAAPGNYAAVLAAVLPHPALRSGRPQGGQAGPPPPRSVERPPTGRTGGAARPHTARGTSGRRALA